MWKLEHNEWIISKYNSVVTKHDDEIKEIIK